MSNSYLGSAKLFYLAVALSCSIQGRDLYVNPRTGDDHADGIAKPVKSIARAVLLAAPGDTVNLDPAGSP